MLRMATRDEVRAFWEDTRAALARVPIDATVEPVDTPAPFLDERPTRTRTVHRVIMSSFEDKRIRGWYCLPAGVPPAHGWPAVLEVPGYAGVLALPMHLIAYGYATLSLFPRGQGESAQDWKLEQGTRLTYNVTDRDRYYYRGAYMDCVRGVDFLSSQPEIDASRVGVWGYSQGGGLSLATAALDRRIGATVAGVPWLCNFPMAAESSTPPYSELRDYVTQHPDQRQQALETLTYFDQLTLSQEITSPVLAGGSSLDEVHPIRSWMPVFEKIPTLKSAVVYPDTEHGWRADFTAQGKAWLDRYLR